MLLDNTIQADSTPTQVLDMDRHALANAMQDLQMAMDCIVHAIDYARSMREFECYLPYRNDDLAPAMAALREITGIIRQLQQGG